MLTTYKYQVSFNHCQCVVIAHTSISWVYNFPCVFFSAFSYGYTLDIDGQHFTKLGGFVNFEGVTSGNIFLEAPKMCYPGNETFRYWAKDGEIGGKGVGYDESCGMLISIEPCTLVELFCFVITQTRIGLNKRNHKNLIITYLYLWIIV